MARRREWRRRALLRKKKAKKRADRDWADTARGDGVSQPLRLLPTDPDRIPPLGVLAGGDARGPAAYYARQVPYAFTTPPSRHPLARRRRPSFVVRAPEVFSFIDRPEEALAFIERTLVAFARSPERRVSINQDRCRQIDYGAASVLCALALDARRFGIQLSGTYPVDPAAREIVESTGLPKLLGLVDEPPAHIRSFELRCGRRGRHAVGAASDRNRVTTEFVEHLDGCLGEYGVELSDDGKHYLGLLFGEAIGNAEDHGGRPEWWVGGYLRRPPGSAVGDLNVAVFNFGNTIAQTVAQLPPASMLGVRLRRLIAHQRESGLYHRSYSPDETWTLGAIQEGVSRVNDQIDRIGHRGTGTFHMADTFHKLSRPPGDGYEPKMVIVSGRSRIVFDGRHQMIDTPTDYGESRAIVAFNDANDLKEPPNPRNVHRLERVFPGTAISLRVYLDAAHLHRLASPQP